ncbi:MAG: very short patch repair endonuclease [Armatimonadota bacterium]|nr:very short patch repair endonuclease [Armatimonadota bacterium]
MPSNRTQEQISEIMRRVKSRDTTPEIAFRKALWASGVRYRLHDARLPGKPDIVIPKSRLLVFIDGDFWHGNQYRKRGHATLEAQFVASPKAEYWVPKIDGNMRRDRKNTAQALAEGWNILRFWESDIKSDLPACIETTLKAIKGDYDYPIASRLPQQTAIVFTELSALRPILEECGWSVTLVENSAAASEVTLAAAVFEQDDLKAKGCAWDFMDLLSQMGPKLPPIALMECPPEWIRNKYADVFAEFLYKLSRLGYCIDAFTMMAKENYDTLYVLAVVEDVVTTSISEELKLSETRPREVFDFISRRLDIKWFLGAVPVIDENSHRNAVDWILCKYLNPAINQWIHGRVLSPVNSSVCLE